MSPAIYKKRTRLAAFTANLPANLTLDQERAVWGRRLVKIWASLYLALWLILTAAMAAENDWVVSGIFAATLAFVASFLIVLFVSAPLVAWARWRAGRVTPDEIMTAVVFLIAILFVFPVCWLMKLGNIVALAIALFIYQLIIIATRNSTFRKSLLSDSAQKIFPTAEQ